MTSPAVSRYLRASRDYWALRVRELGDLKHRSADDPGPRAAARPMGSATRRAGHEALRAYAVLSPEERAEVSRLASESRAAEVTR